MSWLACLSYNCKHNSIHYEDRVKGYCELEDGIYINEKGECAYLEQIEYDKENE